jgi:hypothetical protein
MPLSSSLLLFSFTTLCFLSSFSSFNSIFSDIHFFPPYCCFLMLITPIISLLYMISISSRFIPVSAIALICLFLFFLFNLSLIIRLLLLMSCWNFHCFLYSLVLVDIFQFI